MESTLGPWTELPWFMVTPPSPKREAIPRPRISAILDQATTLALVCAPSGYGKTAATAQWTAGRPRTGWLSGTSSAETTLLIRGVLLRLLPEPVRSALLRIDPNDPTPTVAEVLGGLTQPLTLVIDDAHLLDPETLRSMLCSEPVLASGRLKLVLVGTGALEERFARELAMGDALQVPPRDLAFTVEEIALAAEASGLDLDDVDLNATLHETGGWPIAVRLSLLARRESARLPSTILPGALEGEGVDPLLTDYIEHALLPGIPLDLAQFVLDCTTIRRLDVRLAAALTGDPTSGVLLERCARAGLFLDRYVDPERGIVYLWHEAFASHVRVLLQRRDPLRAAQLKCAGGSPAGRVVPRRGDAPRPSGRGRSARRRNHHPQLAAADHRVPDPDAGAHVYRAARAVAREPRHPAHPGLLSRPAA